MIHIYSSVAILYYYANFVDKVLLFLVHVKGYRSKFHFKVLFQHMLRVLLGAVNVDEAKREGTYGSKERYTIA